MSIYPDEEEGRNTAHKLDAIRGAVIATERRANKKGNKHTK